VFPDTPTVEAPDWICDAPVDGIEVTAVGSFQKTKAGVQFQKDQATAAARNALAAQMQVHVKNLLKNYAETTGVGDEETVDTVSSSVTKQLTAATLVGSRKYKSRTSPNGTMYVLVGLDPTAAAANTQAALKTSYNNKRAAWQKFVGEKAHDELEAEFEKIANQDFN
ncbi:hypothetical protein MNBD_GAMMA16-710, partial [hydrothermal vent metagenome]